MDDGISNALLIQVVMCEIVYGPITAKQIQRCMDMGSLPIPLHLCTDNKGLFSALGATSLKAPAETTPDLFVEIYARQIGSWNSAYDVVGRHADDD